PHQLEAPSFLPTADITSCNPTWLSEDGLVLSGRALEIPHRDEPRPRQSQFAIITNADLNVPKGSPNVAECAVFARSIRDDPGFDHPIGLTQGNAHSPKEADNIGLDRRHPGYEYAHPGTELFVELR